MQKSSCKCMYLLLLESWEWKLVGFKVIADAQLPWAALSTNPLCLNTFKGSFSNQKITGQLIPLHTVHMQTVLKLIVCIYFVGIKKTATVEKMYKRVG